MKKLLVLIIILLVIFFLAKNWWNSQLSAVSGDKTAKVFVITKGAGVSEIAKKLEKENLIKSQFVFKIYVKQNNLTDKLQAGSYRLSSSMSVSEMVKTLKIGSEDIWVTLIEGWRVEEMADRLNKELGTDKGEFLKNAQEGYMFPDTYLFPKEATVSYITDTLRKTFDNRFTEDLKSKIRVKGLTEAQGVILASIVEREARSAEVRTQVASILLKRFKIGMGLNVDATLQYALGYQQQEKSWWKRNLSAEDKRINSPYNT